MIEFTRNQMYETNMIEAMKKLAEMSGLKNAIMVRVAKMMTEFGNALMKAEMERETLISDFCERDESGKVKVADGNPVYKPGGEAAFKEAYPKWANTMVVLTGPKFELYEINPNSTFSAAAYNALKLIIKD